MIVVNVGKVIDANMNLREDETREKVKSKLYATARGCIYRDFNWYKQHNDVPDNLSFNEFQLKLKEDSLFKAAHLAKYCECLRNHFIAYIGEIAVHYLLGEDWHLVFKFNDVNTAHQPDGYINVADDKSVFADMIHGHFDVDAEEHPYQWPEDPTARGMLQISFNVKTSAKNEWGLTANTRYRLQEDFYILAHYRAGFIRLVGYTSRDELERHPRSKYGKYDMPRYKLHPIEYFTADQVFDGLKVCCGSRWDDVSKFLP
jgi:hypothetical protein